MKTVETREEKKAGELQARREETWDTGFIPGYVSCLRVSGDMGSILNARARSLTHFHQTDKQNPHTVCSTRTHITTIISAYLSFTYAKKYMSQKHKDEICRRVIHAIHKENNHLIYLISRYSAPCDSTSNRSAQLLKKSCARLMF